MDVFYAVFMYSRDKNVDTLPLIELRAEPLIREIGPARFWNADDVVLTHLFNAINQVDWHLANYMIVALEQVCDTQSDLPENLVAHVRAYIKTLRQGTGYNAEHLELLQQLGYSNSVPEKLRFENALPKEKLGNQELVALASAYSWMTLCLTNFLLEKQWFLLATAVKPAVVFRWRMLVESVHKGLLAATMQQLGVDAAMRRKGWNMLDRKGMRLFFYFFFRLLKADGCFAGRQWVATVSALYRVFMTPSDGYLWKTLHFKREYHKNAGDSRVIDNAQKIDDFLLNARLYLDQVNPEVDNEAFFSGRYFQNL